MANGAIVVDVVIAEAEDIVPPNDPADHGKALVRNSTTHKYEHVAIGGEGGGTSDHAALTHLDYADSGHTGFAGIDTFNAFTRGQYITASIADLIDGGYLAADSMSNGDFSSGDLTDWTDDASGWNVIAHGGGYALSHTPGSDGTLTQDVAGINGEVFVLEFSIADMTAGYVDVYGTENLYAEAASNGIWRSLGYVASDPTTITIYVSNDFDGLIEYVSLKRSQIGYLPVLILQNERGNGSEIRVSSSSLFWGNSAGKHSIGSGNVGIGESALDSIYLEGGNIGIGNSAGGGARCNGGIFIGAQSGLNETVDNRFHIGPGGDIISGTMASGDASLQSLKFHAVAIDVSDLPTSPGATGTLWVDEANGGVLKRA